MPRYIHNNDFVTVANVCETENGAFFPIQTTTVPVEIAIIFCRLYYFCVTSAFFSNSNQIKILEIVILKESFFCEYSKTASSLEQPQTSLL